MHLISTLVTLISFTTIANAQVEIDKSQLHTQSTLRILKVTGKDAQTLRKLVSDHEMQPDHILSQAIDKNDSSSIKSIKCETDTCVIKFEGDAQTNKDAQEYYSAEYNKILLSLKDNQVFISGYPKDFTGSPSRYEARILRLMQENMNEIPGISEKVSKPLSSKLPDNTGSLLYTLNLKMNSINLTCYSYIMTGMGNQNFLSEVCGLGVIADVK